MIQYLIGSVITAATIIMFQLLGICMSKNKKSFSYSFIAGYICYSFFVAAAGILIQILNLPWKVFFYYMILLLLGIAGYIFYNLYNRKIEISSQQLKSYIKDNRFLFLGAVLILGLALTHIDLIWSNNLTDDSFYLNKIASLPYLDHPFRIDYVTGFKDSAITTYHLNTFELEASFYVYISGLNPVLYTRFFLSFLNYFILLNAIQAFFIEFLPLSKSEVKSTQMPYIIVPIFLLIVMCSFLFTDTDAYWTILSAAYFGSALVRIGAIFICLTPLISLKQLDVKSVLTAFACCVVMVSKSTIAVPLLFVVAVGYLLSLTQKRNWKLTAVLLLSVCLAGLLLPDSPDLEARSFNLILSNLMMPMTLLSLAVISFKALKSKAYGRILVIVLTGILLILIPEINDSFEFMSYYFFVSERTVYAIMIFIQTIGVITLICDLCALFHERSVKIFGMLASVLIMAGVFITKAENADLIGALKVYRHNIYLIPNNTIKLGEALEEYYDETGNKLIVMMQPGLETDGYTHFDAAILRSFSFHSESVVASIRVEKECTNKESDFYGFSIDDLNEYSAFFLNPSKDTLMNIAALNRRYPFNAIVTTVATDEQTELLFEIGYQLYRKVSDSHADYVYSIFIKQ